MQAISPHAGPLKLAGYLLPIALLFMACNRQEEKPRASYVPLSQIESSFGRLVTAGNHPTADQMGTGDRLGLFRDSGGTIWGLPLAVTKDSSVSVCAPAVLHDAPVTDHYPADSTVIGATNEPTGWRGGTGKLELLLRNGEGKIEWQAVSGAHLDGGPVCWAQDPPGPKQPLLYYRLAPSGQK